MADEPRNVKEILVEMKDISELMIDLAFSAVMYDNKEMAEEVLALEEYMNELQRQARMTLVLSGRNREEAEQLLSIFSIVSGAEKISDAADDIATVVTGDMPVPAAFRAALTESYETTAKFSVSPGTVAPGTTVESFETTHGTGSRIIAVRRGSDWLFDPADSVVLQEEDTIFVRGPQESVQALYQDMDGVQFSPGTAGEENTFQDLAGAIIDMKDLMDLATGLAYGAVLFNNRELAEEVLALESQADSMRDHVETAILSAASAQDASELRGVYQLATASEIITDAAMEIASTVPDDVKPHPVLVEANLESDEAIIRAVVGADSPLAGKKLGDTELVMDLGMTAIAVQQNGEWTYDPDQSTVLDVEDVLILRGPSEHQEQVHEL